MSFKTTLDTIESSALNTIYHLLPIQPKDFTFAREIRAIAMTDTYDLIDIARGNQPALFSWLPVERRMTCDIN